MLIAIFGTGRNGSTLLTHILDGIPGTYVHPVEVSFLSVWSDLASLGRVRRVTIQNATQDTLKGLDQRLPTELLMGFYDDQFRQLEQNYIQQIVETIPLGRDPRQALRDKPDYSLTEFTRAFLTASANWINNNQPVDHIIFKTIDVAYVREHEPLFPDMKFVHIVRDPIAVYSSVKRSVMCNKSFPSWYLGHDNLETMIDHRWLPHANFILERKGSPRHRLIRYEDMTKDATGEIASLCAWLGVPIPKEPTKQTALGGHFMKNIHVKPSQKGVETPVEVQENMGKKMGYQEVITPRERELITYKTRALAQPLGYLQDAPTVSGAHVAALWLLPDRWEFIHSRNVLGALRSVLMFFLRRFYVFRSVLAG